MGKSFVELLFKKVGTKSPGLGTIVFFEIPSWVQPIRASSLGFPGSDWLCGFCKRLRFKFRHCRLTKKSRSCIDSISTIQEF